MTIHFSASSSQSAFRVGQRVRIDIATLYPKSPYETIEGTVYQVRVDFPLLWTTQPDFETVLPELSFRYGVLPDTQRFPKMKDIDNELYDLPEAYLSPVD
ncbi:MAG: hypothetical protein ACK4GN_09905 [Runella sp.]